ncbi:MAG: hypothetical protein HLUCCA04_12500 [Oceanicaulis sp. HLUCCA04]|nr:MAG: hypothetical protein HLUCCA04_12500 [Oceanicaulis sp. HLUCCA04]
MVMSEREQFSWVWLGSLALFYGGYFVVISILEAVGEVGLFTRLGLLTAAAAASGLAIGLNALLARSRREPDEVTARDERDRAIGSHARSVAYGVLLVGMIVVGCVMPFGATEWEIVQSTIFVIVIAEIVSCAVVIASYRRGWRV